MRRLREKRDIFLRYPLLCFPICRVSRSISRFVHIYYVQATAYLLVYSCRSDNIDRYNRRINSNETRSREPLAHSVLFLIAYQLSVLLMVLFWPRIHMKTLQADISSYFESRCFADIKKHRTNTTATSGRVFDPENLSENSF